MKQKTFLPGEKTLAELAAVDVDAELGHELEKAASGRSLEPVSPGRKNRSRGGHKAAHAQGQRVMLANPVQLFGRALDELIIHGPISRKPHALTESDGLSPGTIKRFDFGAAEFEVLPVT
ncbi:hypothetical protein [Mesorhizobium sp. WSM3860]|uniref:hypothetical protein n=1 Tax=Mesorhizobium sp. WSM3860 TaxID=2029403 RepID=UPI001140C0FD|nr:hypothetical protein [Mesorhizobium sp. WSM3860]